MKIVSLSHNLTKMNSEFKGIIELLDYFKDEEICNAYFENKRWGGNITCPHCGHNKIYRTNRGYKCANKECYKKFSVTVGTIFEDSNVPLRTWFATLFLVTTSKKGISSMQLSRQLNLTQKTAWFMLQRIREMLQIDIISDEPLNGMVAADESFIGGKNKNRHKDKKVENSQGRSFIDKTPVLGLVEGAEYHFNVRPHKVIPGRVVKEKVITKPSRVFCHVIPNTKLETIQPIVKAAVKQGSILVTDEWSAYHGLNKHFDHKIVDHKSKQYITEDGHSTNAIEGFWTILKRGYIGMYHYMSKTHLHRYCGEFGFRYNTKNMNDGNRFGLALESCSGVRLRYKDLIGK
jgi:transposase-like protein